MFPTLSYLIKYLFNISVPFNFPTFGFFMFISFLAGFWAFQEEMKRKEKLGLIIQIPLIQVIGEKASLLEILGNAIFGFLFAFKIAYIAVNWGSFLVDPQKFIFSKDGNWIIGIIGFLVFGAWVFYDKWKVRLPEPKTTTVMEWPHTLLGNAALIAAGAGILGAKLFDNLENWDRFIQDPIGNMISGSGLTFYGGLIFGGIGVLWYMNKNGVKPLMMLDIGAPGMMLSYALGRIGCQLSGDGDWGIVNNHIKPAFLNWLPDWVWAFNFPHNVINQDDFNFIPGCTGDHCNVLKNAVYPTSFYETIICLILFLVLWALRKRIHISGQLFFIYMILNGTERFFIELIRVNTRYHLGSFSFTQAELIASLLFFSGIIASIWVSKNKPETPIV